MKVMRLDQLSVLDGQVGSSLDDCRSGWRLVEVVGVSVEVVFALYAPSVERDQGPRWTKMDPT